MKLPVSGFVVAFLGVFLVSGGSVFALTETLRPNGVGNSCNLNYQVGAACPDHYQNVDEIVADDATTLVGHNTDNTSGTDTYALPNSAIGATDTINSVKVYIRGDTNGAAHYHTVLRTHATNYEGSALSPLTYTQDSTTYTTNPNTGTAWTLTEINDLEAGTSVFRSPSDLGVVTQIYVEVDYTAGSSTTTSTTTTSTTTTNNGDMIFSLAIVAFLLCFIFLGLVFNSFLK